MINGFGLNYIYCRKEVRSTSHYKRKPKLMGWELHPKIQDIIETRDGLVDHEIVRSHNKECAEVVSKEGYHDKVYNQQNNDYQWGQA